MHRDIIDYGVCTYTAALYSECLMVDHDATERYRFPL